VRTGDVINLNTQTGEVNALVDAKEFAARKPEPNSAKDHHWGMGREMFGAFRVGASSAETGATNLFDEDNLYCRVNRVES